MTVSIRSADELDRVAGCHDMLLRLAGRLPDDLIAQARSWLAERDLGKLAQAVAWAVTAQRMAPHPDDAALLVDLLGEAGLDSSKLEGLDQAEHDVVVPYLFQPVTPDEAEAIREHGGEIPVALDLTIGVPNLDPADAAAVEAVAALPGVHGLWRAWRSAANGAAWPLPRRVYLVEAADPADRPRLAAALQGALEAAGEVAPQVEVNAVGETSGYYQRTARGAGALLWAHQPAPRIENAAVFDSVDPARGAVFAPDHPKVADATAREALLAYLDGGHELVWTNATLDDVVDPGRGQVVPLNFRTDGTWIWPGVVTYYLREHHLRPDDRLVEHIEKAEFRLAPLDGVAIFRTLTKLQEPPTGEPVWRFPDNDPEWS
ncbi:hypothetical protein [Micromonospora sp. RTGN7]|uniref:hypothetical protein n=1 Tax=Micromonospora sp. RTGN7 TaxID=3016526 RepID=UPI0029FF1D9F|nr:hypothetical protein [Micromonospora sp. RTGN7]